MRKVVIFADDLTGANDTAAVIAGMGWKTVSLVRPQSRPEILKEFECISINMDSRDMDSRDAYGTVFETSREFVTDTSTLYSKRIDSTLRGNLGAESDALLDSFESMGEMRIALIVPAAPDAGRIYEKDTIRVNGFLLEQTEAAKDPKRPVRTSSALTLFSQQSKYQTEVIGLETVRTGENAVKQAIQRCVKRNVRNVLIEAVTERDIHVIARAAVLYGNQIIAVDPGAFTAALLEERFGRKDGVSRKQKTEDGVPKILAVIGSVNPVTKRQAEYTLEQSNAACVILNVEEILEAEEGNENFAEQIMKKSQQICENNHTILLMFSSSVEKEHIDLKLWAESGGTSVEELCRRLNAAIASVAADMLKQYEYKAVFTTGGDITMAVCEALHADHIVVKEEILPMAVGGEITLVGGRKIGLATKGGMIGGADAICKCLDYLKLQ